MFQQKSWLLKEIIPEGGKLSDKFSRTLRVGESYRRGILIQAFGQCPSYQLHSQQKSRNLYFILKSDNSTPFQW